MANHDRKYKVSIITVSYNSGITIEKTLKSVLKQTYKNIEYFIIDGLSCDNTVSIVNKYVPLFQGRIKVISEPDSGIYEAMNKGIALSTGDVVGIINSNDFYEEDAVENIMKNYCDDIKYQVIYGMQRTLECGLERDILFYNHRFLNKQMITHSTCFVTRKIYEDFGHYRTDYKSASDYEFMLRIKNNPEVHFKPVYKVISNFSTGGISSTYIGDIESAKIRKTLKFISQKEYLILLGKAYIKKILS